MADNLTPTHKLMKALVTHNLDALIIDHDDPHATEIPHEAFGGLEFVSKFTGSWGQALVSTEGAWLWTDSRYYIQAARELQQPWELMPYGMKDVPDLPTFIKTKGYKKIGIDAHTTPQKVLEHYESVADTAFFVELYKNPIYEIWDSRPTLPVDHIFIHPEKYTGMSTIAKLTEIRGALKKEKADAVVFSVLDEIAYVLNLRGSDCDTSPLFYSYLVVGEIDAVLFIDERKVPDSVRDELASWGVQIMPYEELFLFLRHLPQKMTKKNDVKTYTLWASHSASVAICDSFMSGDSKLIQKRLIQKPTPACWMKAIKNKVELEGMTEAHIQDAIALAEFFAKVENMKQDGTLFTADELILGSMSSQCRADMPDNRGISFHPISSIGSNCAVVHYRATEEIKAKIEPKIYLLDSGGQYPGGTTDVTRTIHFGTPSDEEKEAYTQVLKGHLALGHAIFPEHTSGATLDILARQYLWASGRNYYHGTGHGVGSYLNVHEGPMSISLLTKPRMGDYKVIYLEPGMVLSNEPGFYKEGHYGIRIENMIYVKPVEGDFSKDKTEFLTFETLTLVPYCKELMNIAMLSQQEIDWINQYHARIADILLPRMEALSPTKYADAIKYIKAAAEPISV
uniref:Metallopeptidase M24 family protein n=2 Tax=Babesia bovis TaxID=5865 RepID=A7APB3_BABBO|eukprot:XP_001611965.1 metallopeptidase M24 family protein [Babesia bovis T2Bo]